MYPLPFGLQDVVPAKNGVLAALEWIEMARQCQRLDIYLATLLPHLRVDWLTGILDLAQADEVCRGLFDDVVAGREGAAGILADWLDDQGAYFLAEPLRVVKQARAVSRKRLGV